MAVGASDAQGSHVGEAFAVKRETAHRSPSSSGLSLRCLRDRYEAAEARGECERDKQAQAGDAGRAMALVGERTLRPGVSNSMHGGTKISNVDNIDIY